MQCDWKEKKYAFSQLPWTCNNNLCSLISFLFIHSLAFIIIIFLILHIRQVCIFLSNLYPIKGVFTWKDDKYNFKFPTKFKYIHKCISTYDESKQSSKVSVEIRYKKTLKNHAYFHTSYHRLQYVLMLEKKKKADRIHVCITRQTLFIHIKINSHWFTERPLYWKCVFFFTPISSHTQPLIISLMPRREKKN